MTITKVSTGSLGGTLSATVEATGAIEALVATSMPGLNAKIESYVNLSMPSPSFDIGTQLANAGANLSADLDLVAAIPGIGAALKAAIAAGVTAMATLRTANPELGTKIDASVSAIGGLNAQIKAGLIGPNVNVTLIESLLAELQLAKATIEAKANLASSLGGKLSTGGIIVYRFDGNIANAGAELQAQVNADGVTGMTHFVVILPTTPSGWSSIQATMSVS